jgi:hypothetical protein
MVAVAAYPHGDGIPTWEQIPVFLMFCYAWLITTASEISEAFTLSLYGDLFRTPHKEESYREFFWLHILSTIVLKLITKSVLVYNAVMMTEAVNILLEDAVRRDRTTARRAALVEILLQERFLTREQLIVRVEGKLGKGCFGDAAWEDAFYRDMQVVKQALRASGYQPAYSRSSKQPGYYLRNQSRVGPELAALLTASVSEADRSQIEIIKNLTFAQRFRQGCSVSNLARNVVAHRIRQRFPTLSMAEAQRLAIQERKEA